MSALDSVGSSEELFAYPLSDGFHAVGGAFCSILAKAFEWTIHAFCTPIRPGEFDNYGSYPLELASRVATVALSVLVAPIAVVLTLAGQLIHAIGDRISGLEYTYLRGEAPIDEVKRQLTFLTHNVCMIGPWAQIFGGLSARNWRIDKEAELILNQDADFVLLQEAEYTYALGLYEHLKNRYPHNFLRIGPNPPTMESCLFLASKQPLMGEPKFVEFPNLSIGMRRGFFYVETESCFVFTTHLSPKNTLESQETRRQQLALIIETMQTLNKPCFLLGDLNIVRTGQEGDEYALSGIAENFVDPYPDLTPTCTDYLNESRKGYPDPQHNWELVDYTLARGIPADQLAVEVIESFDLENLSYALSDHKALKLVWAPPLQYG